MTYYIFELSNINIESERERINSISAIKSHKRTLYPIKGKGKKREKEKKRKKKEKEKDKVIETEESYIEVEDFFVLENHFLRFTTFY